MENEIEYIYPATSLQQGFIYHALSQSEDDAYRIQILTDYHSPLDVDVYVKAWEYCILQYPILRTAFNWDESMIQLICKYGKLNHQFHDISHLPSAEEREAAIKHIQVEDRKKSFDLSQPTLLRLHIIKQSDNFYTVLKNVHHSIADGWSESVLSSSLHGYYKQLKENKIPTVKVDTAYMDSQEYITDHSDRVQGYWEKRLADVEGANDINPLLSKPIDLLNYKQVEHFVSVELEMTGDFYQGMKAFAKEEGITINVMVQFAWHKLLQTYSNRLKSIVGTTVSGRDLPVDGIEESVGLYINTLPLIIDWENNNTVTQQLHDIQQKITELNTHSFANLAKLQKHGERLFHSLFAYENFPASKEENDDLKMSVRNFIEKVDYPLGVSVYETSGSLIIKLTYDSSYLTADRAQSHLTTIESILHQVLDQPGKIHNRLSLLSSEDYKKIIFDWNDTDSVFSKGDTIIELFKAQVAISANQTAIVYQGIETSYQQLDEQSDLLANYLIQNYQLQGNPFIGIMLDRSAQMLVAILAVLKAGAAYVPIDPKLLMARKKYILEDAGITVLISQTDYIFDLEFYTGNLFAIDIQLDSIEKPVHTTLPIVQPDDLAYVIYTSGTTGNPKGAMIRHKSAVNYVNNVNNILLPTVFNIDFSTNISFDLTITTSICGLLLGKKIFIYADELSNVESYVQHLVDNNIDFIKSTPSLLSNLPVNDFNNHKIKQAFIGGEKLEDSQLIHIRKYVDVLIDEYGPTEATVGTTYIQKSTIDTKGIGKPYSNYKVYVLNPSMIPVPVGVIGELYIGGAGLAKGYLNRPDLTAERFIENPFATALDTSKQYTRLYKTGDLVRWLPDGSLEFIGRNDHQIKIRGYRVELGEIEHAFNLLEDIRQACVLSKNRSDGSKYLVAYCLLNTTTETIDQSVIAEKLSKLLPEYMIPSVIVALESFPLTSNGKINRDAFPDPDVTSSKEHVAPGNELESLICNVWQEILNLEKISVTDNFFRIGGDSILSIQVSSRLRQLGYSCQVKDIFECKTISKLAVHLSSENASLLIKTEQGILSGDLGFLPVQQHFTSNADRAVFGNPNHYNHSFLIKVPGLDVEKLSAIMNELVSYHDVLRVRYLKEKGNWKQFYESDITCPPVKELDVSTHSDSEIQDILTQWQSNFDLEKGPLFQAGYLHGYADGSARIYFALHHLIIDSVSWRILSDDIRQLYMGKALPQKGSSYRQWVESIQNYPQTHASESIYWEIQLKDIPNYRAFECKEELITSIGLDKNITKILLQEASKAYHTEVNDLLLTALAYSLKVLNQSNIQGLSLDGHGRESIDPEIDHSRTLGWFTSIFPVRLELKDTLSESIQSIKEYLRNIPNKGIGFGAFSCSKDSRFGFDDLAPISFNYLGQFDTQEGDWQIVSEHSGNSVDDTNEDRNVLNINGMVNHGKLEFTIVSKLGSHLTKQLGDRFEAELIRIVNHCHDMISKNEVSHTPSDFPFVHIDQKSLDHLERSAREHENEVVQLYPANSLQRGFIYHALSQPADDAYRVQVLFDYHESLNIPLYLESWKYCIRQYPILRTAFNWEGEPIQVIYKHGKLNYQLHDISQLMNQQERDEAIHAIQQEDRRLGFDLKEPGLFRLHLIKQSEDLYTVLKTEHHSIADGWSGQVLLSSVHGYYQQLKRNQVPLLKEDVAYLETQEYMAKNKNGVHHYWQKALQAAEGTNDITDLLSRTIDTNYKKIEEVSNTIIEITGKAYTELKNFVIEHGVTTNALLQFSWHKLLQVYSHSLKTIVGTTISGRDLPIHDIENSVGLYINTLPLLIDWDNDHSIAEQLHQIQQKIIELNTHSFADLSTLQSNGERLFYSLFDYANYPAPKEQAGSTKVDLRNSIEKVDYPLSIQAYEYNDSLVVILQHDRSCLSQEKASHHLETLKYILSQAIKEASKSHRRISLLKPEEYQKMVYDWNATDREYPKDQTIHALFEQQVRKNPEAIALAYEDNTLSYRELDEKSDQLAHYIRSEYTSRTNQSISADTLIALYLDKSLEMVIGIMAVLKAGGAYVPMDSSYPQERVDFILEDTGTDLILVQKHLVEKNALKLPKHKTLNIDLEEALYNEDHSDLLKQGKSSDLAYVIYTSGTTGKPKGSMIEHKAVLSLVFNDYIETDPSDVFAFFSSPAFDAATFEIFTPLLRGNKLVIPKDFNNLISDVKDFKSFMTSHGISSLWLTKTLFDNLYYLDNDLFEHLNHLIIGGEALDKNTVQKLVAGPGKPNHFLNGYGPTESTTFTCVHDLTQVKDTTNVPIGKPINNRKTYILDSGRNPVPVGVVGELYIAGAGLARGYLNHVVLTNDCFVLNPFATETDRANGYDRLYKTGDTVKWLPDGTIEYIGRNDDQVKIRGFRIELHEIEHRLSQMKGIRQACVIVKEHTTSGGTDKHLIAYYVPADEGDRITPAFIEHKLSEALPAYMMPTAFIEMDALPTTTNGKLDKRALPDPDIRSSSVYVPPVTELEIKLCAVWEETLGLNQVGMTDNFFSIGGNSIKAIQLTNQMNKVLDGNIKIADLFRSKTIQNLMLALRNADAKWVKPYYGAHNPGLPNLIFIHPGNAGCEVYQELADQLRDNFNCIGIDNFNVHSEEKISSLNKLASLYLIELKQHRKLTEPVILVGWSLGGMIALEMASILEREGSKNSRVVLLDTWVSDEISSELVKRIDMRSHIREFRDYSIKSGQEKHYVEKIISALEVEVKLNNSAISNRLTHTQVTLFKALQEDTRITSEIFESLHKHAMTRPDNNVKQLADQVEIINLDCHHGSILEMNIDTISHYLISKLDAGKTDRKQERAIESNMEL